MNDIQKQGIQIGLTEEQINHDKFNEHTLKLIKHLTSKNSPNIPEIINDFMDLKVFSPAKVNKTISEIFNLAILFPEEKMIKELLELKLELKDFFHENFGPHTVFGIIELKKNDPTLKNEEAFKMVKGLSRKQIKGLFTYKLNLEDVKRQNYKDIYIILEDFKKQRKELPIKETYDKLKNLTPHQLQWVKNALSIDDVVGSKFNRNKILAAEIIKQDDGISYKESFDMAKNLNEIQIKMLTRKPVHYRFDCVSKTPTHILEALNFMLNKYEAQQIDTHLLDKLYWDVHKLNEAQCASLITYKIPLEEVVKNKKKPEHTNDWIKKLIKNNPNITGFDAFKQIEGLNNAQIKGFVDYKLSKKIVSSNNFGNHTLTAIKKLKKDKISLTNEEAFEIVKGLNKHQTTMITDYGLTREQVLDSKFSEATKKAILTLIKKKNLAIKDAYKWVVGLSSDQAEAVNIFLISREQAMHKGFNEESYLKYMRKIKDINPHLKSDEIFNRVTQFNCIQLRGIYDFDLTDLEVKHPNFGDHTLNKIFHIKGQQQNLTNRAAFALVEGMNKAQIKGVYDYHLPKAEVLCENFDEYTIIAINKLKRQHKGLTNLRCFKMVKGLNLAQCVGYTSYRIPRDKINDPTFGLHHIKAMEKLTEDYPSDTYEDIFAKIEGLKKHQTEGITIFNLSREQVENQKFSIYELIAMKVLFKASPQQKGEHLYETVMQTMREYQIRGILKYGLTLAQVGIGISNNKFVQKNPEDPNFSENTLNAMKAIKLQKPDLTRQEAYNKAITLNNKQVLCLMDFGLKLDQVNSEEFRNSADTIMAELIEKLEEGLGDDYELPLDKKHHDMARAEFKKILANLKIEKKTTPESETRKRDLNELTQIQSREHHKKSRINRNNQRLTLNGSKKRRRFFSQTD